MAQVTLKSMAAGDDWSGDSRWFTSTMFLAEAYGWSPTRPWGPDAPTPLISRYRWKGDMFILPADARSLAAALRGACGAPLPLPHYARRRATKRRRNPGRPCSPHSALPRICAPSPRSPTSAGEAG